MRLLKFNDTVVDIDDQTAIGIDFQGYDITDPGKRKISVSNSFTIPPTSVNNRLIGFAADPQSLNLSVYQPIIVNYWNENKQLIRNGKARITEVGARISVMVYEKLDFWDLMGDFLWHDFLTEYVTWLGLPSATTPHVGTFQSFVDLYTDSNEGIILPFTIGHLATYSPDELTYLEDTSKLWLKYAPEFAVLNIEYGGHFGIYCKSIFEFIEYKYGVDLSVNDTSISNNIFQDAIASVMYVMAPSLSIAFAAGNYWFIVQGGGIIKDGTTPDDKEGKSLYEFTKAFFQQFNCLIDKVAGPADKFAVRRFDEITEAPIVDFSGKFYGAPVFKPTVEPYKQTNYIKFASVYEGGGDLKNAKKITCQNKNIDAGGPDSVLFSIDAYIPGSFLLGSDVVPDLSKPEAFKTFVFFISYDSASTQIKAMDNGVTVTADVSLRIARTYSLDDEYNTIAGMVEYPKMYTFKKWLGLYDVDNIQFFARYFVKELNGYFFLNKISGYNPQKSTEPTTIELIKLP